MKFKQHNIRKTKNGYSIVKRLDNHNYTIANFRDWYDALDYRDKLDQEGYFSDTFIQNRRSLNFYKYISPFGAKFAIKKGTKKDGVKVYNSFKSILDALNYRDKLVRNDWNLEWVETDNYPNMYTMDNILPFPVSWNKYVNKEIKFNPNKYIRKKGNRYIIYKWNPQIKIPVEYYRTSDFVEASFVRDKFMEYGFDKKVLPFILNEFEDYHNTLCRFYHYIRKSYKGKYKVCKSINGKLEYSAPFSRLTDALHERDLLEKYDWNYDLLVEDVSINPYENMDLPPFPTNRKGKNKGANYKLNKNSYIYPTNKKFTIGKSINGELIYFGRYETLDDAIKIRDLLIKNNWDKNKVIQNL